MGAQFYRTNGTAMNKSNWMRQAHRWLAIAFTLLVIGNFVAWIDGPPPQWLTYAPLAPLLLMMLTGLALLVQHYAAAARVAPRSMQRERHMTDPVDAIIDRYADWRGDTLSRVRQLIRRSDAQIVEEVKWRKASNPLGVPTWSNRGILCTGEVYKDKVKLTFFKGASLKDEHGLFNTAPSGTRRAIDLREGDELNQQGLEALLREAIAANG